MLSNTENCFLESAYQGAADMFVEGRVWAGQRWQSVIYEAFEVQRSFRSDAPCEDFLCGSIRCTNLISFIFAGNTNELCGSQGN